MATEPVPVADPAQIYLDGMVSSDVVDGPIGKTASALSNSPRE